MIISGTETDNLNIFYSFLQFLSSGWQDTTIWEVVVYLHFYFHIKYEM